MAIRTHVSTIFTAAVAILGTTTAIGYAQSQDTQSPTPVEVRGGTASFDVDTNLPEAPVGQLTLREKLGLLQEEIKRWEALSSSTDFTPAASWGYTSFS